MQMAGRQTLNDKDAIILEFLQRKGSVAELTDEDLKEIDLTEESIHERAKKLEKFGLIKLDQAALVLDKIINVRAKNVAAGESGSVTVDGRSAAREAMGSDWPFATEPYLAMVYVQLPDEDTLNDLGPFICGTPEFAACWEVDGEYDLLIHAIASTQAHLNAILQEMRARFRVRTNKFSVWNAVKPFNGYPVRALRKKV
jgi:DNA-binding Lrp family transcriptional regulator